MAQNSIIEYDQQQSPLFDLPGELRNEIYKAVFSVVLPFGGWEEPDLKEEKFKEEKKSFSRPSRWNELFYSEARLRKKGPVRSENMERRDTERKLEIYPENRERRDTAREYFGDGVNNCTRKTRLDFLAFTKTCHRIRAETKSFLIRQVVFTFQSERSAYKVLRECPAPILGNI
jgi:hypothetical protein